MVFDLFRVLQVQCKATVYKKEGNISEWGGGGGGGGEGGDEQLSFLTFTRALSFHSPLLFFLPYV